MKKWLFVLRQDFGLFFWEILTPAGNLVCRSLNGFSSKEEANADLKVFHPEDHFN